MSSSENVQTSQHAYVLRPSFNNKFRPVLFKEVLKSVLVDYFPGKEYNGEDATQWTKEIANLILDALKGKGFDRYKFVIQVTIGEQKGQGIKMSCRCFWDSDTDNYIQEVFTNESLFCVAACFGAYFY